MAKKIGETTAIRIYPMGEDMWVIHPPTNVKQEFKRIRRSKQTIATVSIWKVPETINLIRQLIVARKKKEI